MPAPATSGRAAPPKARGGAPEGRRHLERSRRIRLSRRGAVVLAAGVLAVVAGYAISRPEYFAVTGAAVALVAGGMLAVRVRRPRFEVARGFTPRIAAAGGVVRVTLRIVNPAGSTSTAFSWNDALPWPEPAAPHRVAGIRPREARTVEYDLHPPRRGHYAIGPLVAEYEDPFGLVVATVAVGEPDRLVVVPAVSPLGEGGPVLTDGEGAAQLVQRRVTGNDDDLTTREYRPGDALRRVHWRATARHGELMVRQEEHRSYPDARILVDTRRAGYGDAAPDRGATWSAEWRSDTFEWAMRMVASLGVHLESCGFRVAVEETARPQIEPIGERWDGHRSEGFLTSLAGVQMLDRRAEDLAALRMPEPVGPCFAVLGRPELVTIDWMLRRRGGERGYVFLAGARLTDVKRLEEAGWVVVEADPEGDPADAWRTAAIVAGVSHGRH